MDQDNGPLTMAVDVQKDGESVAVFSSENQIVFGYLSKGRRQIGRRVLRLMLAEFRRNGRKTLTAGKVRYLRRVARRDKSAGSAEGGLDQERFAVSRTIDMGVLTKEESDLINGFVAR